MYSDNQELIKDYQRSTGKYDKKSDYDVYIYVNSVISKDTRKNILSKYCKNS